MKALIFAAGKGTRLKPFTDHHPKALAKVNGIPLLERNIRYLKGFGISDFVINIHHFGNQIVEFLKRNDDFGCRIEISDESEELLETGGGLVFARRLFDHGEDFLIMNADILTDLNINLFVDYHKKIKDFATLAVSDRESSRKLLFNEELVLRGWLNVQTGEQRLAEFNKGFRPLAFSGVHCINPVIFTKIKRTGKFSIMEEYLDLMHTEHIHGFLHDSILVDVGKPESIAAAEKYFK
ncbi:MULTISPECIES: nucleotidyltransferase family protein [Chryseobacterium]|uniref:MurNAc alpha-1-phosphate uridylyltransferase n=1 Tax=Chryseobacterium camelliae TaxID=1265445 RepID=A0ABU0TN58_9FLAO|nr:MULTISPECIES: nucleotidyltransferase family protein [Chryseobacterium]MDT3407669.1 MurNAc alpha-1-phosphate uridylyltransferase [Pseudacidovorax intermedius]MDQ1098479.1 MurNAc alpha-1-phosphate uridylyltransferase [Chryseobacterium camelliae]MDQ1102402.1 MurNAc alpha-1-phosphate uridylyltransferase [Chryseobacterium sp. SORGH_AS_1048]MDR6085839.1 MurNAc alpha-1-phosphate uridylyltransferase [Chryseobacterium sp. SORGH_AS_0909]MDR6130203.1 MurNAc alpha-1-phosphate uridylyltransferase [Chrys